jgi:hypothetical protein
MPLESALDPTLWVLCFVAIAAAAAAIGVWILVARAQRLEERLARLDKLEEMTATLEKLASNQDGLDLRRLEHVLIDIRDGQKRVEARMLEIVESHARGAVFSQGTSENAGTRAVELSGAAAGGALADRIVTRLLALGYERIVLVTPSEDQGRIAREGGAVVVEAKRDGAACKGRVLVADGRIADIQIQSAYSTFP